eukprot:scaffold103269_cov30-Phaeocystis_antarctica.AAC.1
MKLPAPVVRVRVWLGLGFGLRLMAHEAAGACAVGACVMPRFAGRLVRTVGRPPRNVNMGRRQPSCAPSYIDGTGGARPPAPARPSCAAWVGVG